jgi:transposase-like protein
MATQKPKRKPGPLSDAEKARIRELIAQQKSHRAICDELGIAKATLSRFKTAEGLVTPVLNPHQRTAVEASIRNAAVKRAERLAGLDELYRLREQMLRDVLTGKAKYRTILKGAMGVEAEEELDFIPAADWRAEMSALGTMQTSIDRNDDRADDGGLARAQSMLAKVMEAVAGADITAPEGVITR